MIIGNNGELEAPRVQNAVNNGFCELVLDKDEIKYKY